MNLSTDTTLPPDTVLPGFAEPVPSANRDKPGVDVPTVVPLDRPGTSPAVVAVVGPPTAEPTDETPRIPTDESATGPARLPPSAVPTPVTPEPREALRVAPIIDRPLGFDRPLVPPSETETPRPTPRTQSPAAARPLNPLPAQVRIGSGAAIMVDGIGPHSNWLMIGAVFAVGVLFSVMGAGAVLAGMLYQGAPWGSSEEPVTHQTTPPVPVTSLPIPDPEIVPATPDPEVVADDVVEHEGPAPAPKPTQPSAPAPQPSTPTPSPQPSPQPAPVVPTSVQPPPSPQPKSTVFDPPPQSAQPVPAPQVPAPKPSSAASSAPSAAHIIPTNFHRLGFDSGATLVVDDERRIWDQTYYDLEGGVHDCKVEPVGGGAAAQVDCEIKDPGLGPDGKQKVFNLVIKPL